MELFVQSLRSGSSGNSYLAGGGRTKILVDCGINGKNLAAALTEVNCAIDEISGILLTHEHSDHLSGLGVALRRHRIPLYVSAGTLAAARKALGDFDESLIRLIEADETVVIGDLAVTAFAIPHDAAEPLAYSLETETARLTILTDCGEVQESGLERLRQSDILVLEANYNERMLETGSYPWPLKQRVAGVNGHLSNLQCGKALVEALQGQTKQIILAHLSEENNYPALAALEVQDELKAAGALEGRDYRLDIARRHEVSPRMIRGDMAAPIIVESDFQRAVNALRRSSRFNDQGEL